jgi:hypothetical protein
MTMDDLIARLREAKGDFDECRAFDLEIAISIGWTHDLKRLPGAPMRDPHGKDHWSPPMYCFLIDAALTLVPEGFRWKLGYSRHVPCVAELIDYRPIMEPNLGRFDGECDSTHAIALCIAALHARSALNKAER